MQSDHHAGITVSMHERVVCESIRGWDYIRGNRPNFDAVALNKKQELISCCNI